MRFGILTSGGDCAGLNAVIRAVGLYVYGNMKGAELIGIPDGYGGLIRGDGTLLEREELYGILDRGGTVLGTSRQPFKTIALREDGPSRLERMIENYRKMRLDGLFVLGGAGTHKVASLLSAEGCNVIGIPKTIDNDIYGTEVTFGFQTAVEVAAECIGRISTTTASHGRVMLVEIMGNKAGWLALHAGIAGGAHMILLPEIPFDPDRVCEFVRRRREEDGYALIAVAEGAQLVSEAAYKKKDRAFIRTDRGETTVTPHLAELIAEKTGADARVSVLGYVQRGGVPCAFDRMLCTRLGSYAGRLAAEGRFGVTAAVSGGNITFNALADIAGKYKLVDPEGNAVREAKDIGISFGISR